MSKTIGIIGGMGPAATLDMLNKIYSNSTVGCDQQHLRVLADIDPTIPDRTEAILSGDSKEIVAHLLRNARGLINLGAEILAMPCNTAHAFVREIQGELSVPLVNIVNVTVEHIVERGWNTAGLMATDGTLAAGFYIKELRDHGVKVIVPSREEQAALMKAIYGFKGGIRRESAEMVNKVYQALLGAGAQRIIAACTELPILLEGRERVVDATALLANSVVRRAREG